MRGRASCQCRMQLSRSDRRRFARPSPPRQPGGTDAGAVACTGSRRRHTRPRQPGAATSSMNAPAARQRGIARQLAGDRDDGKDARLQDHRMKGRFLQELPTAPPTTERQVHAAADVGSQYLSGCTQSEGDATLGVALDLSKCDHSACAINCTTDGLIIVDLATSSPGPLPIITTYRWWAGRRLAACLPAACLAG